MNRVSSNPTLPVILFVLFSLQLGCQSGGSDSPPSDPAADTVIEPVPLKFADRLLGVHNSEPEAGFMSSFETSKRASFDFHNLHLIWGKGSFVGDLPVPPLELNTSAGCSGPSTYDIIDRPNDALANIAHAFYPAYKLKLMMTIGVYDTNQFFVPTCAASMRLNSPVVIQMFKYTLDVLFSKINGSPQLDLVSLQIGNEIDAHANLAQCKVNGQISQNWRDYIEFVSQVAPYARSKRSGLKIGVTGTMYGYTNPENRECFNALLSHLDILSVTYYPMDFLSSGNQIGFRMKDPKQVVASEIDDLVGKYPSLPIYFQEAGYSSGSQVIGGSQAKQAQFIKEMFYAWDRHQDRIKLVSFLNLHEWTDSAVDGFGIQYGVCPGITCTSFKEYLKTLGLRTATGTGSDKPAFEELIKQSQLRR